VFFKQNRDSLPIFDIDGLGQETRHEILGIISSRDLSRSRSIICGNNCGIKTSLYICRELGQVLGLQKAELGPVGLKGLQLGGTDSVVDAGGKLGAMLLGFPKSKNVCNALVYHIRRTDN